MKKTTKQTLSMAMFASILLTSSISAVEVKAAPVQVPEDQRLWGQDRYETASKVSQVGWATSDYAIIASGEGYADALCAAPLAKANNAPILLTQKDSLSKATLDELKRLNVKHVYIVGGEGVISKAVEDKIKADVTADVQRFWGQDRFETSVKVAEKVGVTDKIVLASGAGYADALSAAPVAAIEAMPIILTESNKLSTPADNYIKANPGIAKTYVIGGTASVNDDTLAKVPNAERLGGADRFETNAKVIEAFSTDFNYDNIYLALGNGTRGDEFADALSGSAIAAKNGQPVIITDKNITSTTQNLVKSKIAPSSSITILGGVANVPEAIKSNIKISAKLADEKGQTYTGTENGTVDIIADDVVYKANVNGDLYVSANNVTLSSINVTGTIYLNPGDNGVANLDGVTAKDIVVLSGAKNSVHLKNVNAENLKIKSRSDVRAQVQGNTSIGKTTVMSKALLEATSGSFGDIDIEETSKDKTIELKGVFNKLITIKGQANLKTDATTVIEGLLIPDTAKNAKVSLEGLGSIKNIQIKNIKALLNIAKDILVTGKIEAISKDTIKSDNSTVNSKIEEKSGSQMGGVMPSYNDITETISMVYGSKIQENLKQYPTLSKYVTITTGKEIEVKITNSQWASLSEVFSTVKSQDEAKLMDRMSVVSELLDLPFVKNVKVGEESVNAYVNSMYTGYFNKEGKLDAKTIFERIQNKEFNYDLFKTNLANKAKANSLNRGEGISYVLAPASEGKQATTLVIDRIEKDGATAYDKAWTTEKNLEFYNKDKVEDLVGNYKIYSGNNTIKIKIVK